MGEGDREKEAEGPEPDNEVRVRECVRSVSVSEAVEDLDAVLLADIVLESDREVFNDTVRDMDAKRGLRESVAVTVADLLLKKVTVTD